MISSSFSGCYSHTETEAQILGLVGNACFATIGVKEAMLVVNTIKTFFKNLHEI